MIVNSTELQNNFGKYLRLAATEDVMVTRNGTMIAKLSAINEENTIYRKQAGRSSTANESLETYGCGLRKATYEEFQELSRKSEERYEYIDGEVYLLASPKTTHQMVLTELFGVFYKWFEGKPCRPFTAPYDITLHRTMDDIHVVQPDLMVICDLDEKRGEDDYYKGVPSLVVEILSESTRRIDMVKKLDLYLSCGIQEYWIVNPSNEEVVVHLFQDDNISNHKTYKIGETAESFFFPGLSAGLDRIFR